jgi:hypothetical protein
MSCSSYQNGQKGLKMEPDFSGFATHADVKCADGRTISADAFKEMDGQIVPLVWAHGHGSPDNILGHALLESVPNGVRAHGFFNDTSSGQSARALVLHKDISSLSIYANGLVEKAIGSGKRVLHGVIREVSLVLSGANPMAKIDYVRVAHSDGDVEILDDEAVIYTNLPLEHADKSSGPTVQEVYDTLNEEQQSVVAYMIGAALEAAGVSLAQSGTGEGTNSSESSDSTAGGSEGSSSEVEGGEGSSNGEPNSGSIAHEEGNSTVARNLFDQTKKPEGSVDAVERHILHQDDVKGIIADAMKNGSMQGAVEAYCIKHGIDDISVLFPDAKLLTTTPDFNKRRTEWVAAVLNGTRHTPFSRVKTVVADITLDEARAKGYVKGAMKTAEWFGVSKRTTSPTTVYKKQELDRDDVLDITDFDVVLWLKGEMRLMLEEEIARAILIGDGRQVGSADKIKDPIGAADGTGIRSILNDHELFVTTVNVNILDANSSYNEVVDAILDAMEFYKGTGTPVFYTTIRTLNGFLKMKDTTGRRIYLTKSEVAAALGVRDIITVEPMNDETALVGIIVDLGDYNVGADKGGEVNMFDDFDIDYNKQKYLIETRCSGALTKFKSAIVIKSVGSTDTKLSAPTEPTFVPSTGVVTVPTVTHVKYYNNLDRTNALTGGAQTALGAGNSINIIAKADSGYYFDSSADAGPWHFQSRQ